MPVLPDAPRVDHQWFRPKPLISWLAIGGLCLYLSLCWIWYTFSVEPLYGFPKVYSIIADSGAYFRAAGIDSSGAALAEGASDDQISLGGSVIGPAIIAFIFRNEFGVAIFNCFLFAFCVWAASFVPGLSKRVFVFLMIADALTVPALLTLNKEILAMAGCTLFAKYLYAKKNRKLVLFFCLLVSTMARWQQTAFILLFMFLTSRRSFRDKPKTVIFLLLMILSAAWAAIAWRFSGLLASYTALEGQITTGTIARLNAIQNKGGFFLAVWPKILMNVSGRLLQVNYFLNEWIHSDFHELQNTVIGNLHSIAMLALIAWMLLNGRFRLGRPLVHFALFYMIFSSVSPFIQNRYEYPAYVLLAMEMSRKKESLEPLKPMKLLGMTPSYQAMQAKAAISAGESRIGRPTTSG
jgi:hypothetical protein